MIKVDDLFRLKYKVGEFKVDVFIKVLRIDKEHCEVKCWDQRESGEIFHEYETSLSFSAIKELYEKV